MSHIIEQLSAASVGDATDAPERHCADLVVSQC